MRVIVLLLTLILGSCAVVGPSINSEIDAYVKAGNVVESLEIPGSTHEKHYERLEAWLETAHRIPVGVAALPEQLMGVTDCPDGPATCTIVINENQTVNTRYSTLLHEACHGAYKMLSPLVARATAETVCETVAFRAAELTGLNTRKQSFAYLAKIPSWWREPVYEIFDQQISQWSRELAKVSEGG